ncbi:type I secretion system permease/ATPase [Cohaesibacter gelatinilyticus]|nr:type I secretion system permease/ATPase [Cohaesibacter gelatinilyticus]
MNRRSATVGLFSGLGKVWLGIGLISMLINILMLTGPVFMLQVYDRVLASGSVPTLVVLGGLALGLYAFYGLLDGLRSRILVRVGQYVDAHYSGLAYQVSTMAPVLIGNKAQQLRPVQDLDAVRQFLSGQGPAAIFDSPWMPFYLIIVYVFHPILGLVGLVGAIIICLLIGLNEWLTRKPTQEANRETGLRGQLVETGRQNAEAIHAMGMIGALRGRWEGLNQTYLQSQRVSSDRGLLFSTLTKTFRFILQSSILGFGAWLAIQQEITPGIMIAASIMISRALSPIEVAVGQWRAFVGARQAYARLKSIFGQMSEEQEDGMELPLPQKALTVDALSSGPVGLKKPVLQGVSFSLNAGQGLGIIGPSGSGKSTLARSLVGLLPALSGSVRLDGAELTQWAQDRRGEFIGYLPQDVQIFDGTISENISRFAPDASSDSILEAARLADLHEMITALPDGYETRIGSSGFALSGGQRQRVALARAIYGNPFLIVLDEPNSNLDSQGEAALAGAISAMKERGSVIVIIAHRPSALASVDHVLCLKEGKMQACGPKDEVLPKVLSPVPNQGAA